MTIDKTRLKKELNKQRLGSFYKTVEGAEGDKCYYPTRLDTYGKGCYYDCKYCYAKQLLDFRKLWNPSAPATPSIKEILKVVKSIPKGNVVRLGGMTDCFQPIERIKRNTYKTIQLLNKKGVHYLIVTKSDLIIRDEYLQILDKKLAHIQVSIPSTNNNVLKYTDNAKTYESRVKTVETLNDNGFDVQVRLSPCLYNTIDFNKINNINCDKILVEFLRVNPNAKNTMKKIIPLKDYTVKEGGTRHLPLRKKLQILSKIDYKQLTVCDDVQEHYDYFKNNINYNPDDCCNLKL